MRRKQKKYKVRAVGMRTKAITRVYTVSANSLEEAQEKAEKRLRAACTDATSWCNLEGSILTEVMEELP